MNKIYRVVWNAEAGQWVVASEMAKGRKKSATGKNAVTVLSGAIVASGLLAAGTYAPPVEAKGALRLCNGGYGSGGTAYGPGGSTNIGCSSGANDGADFTLTANPNSEDGGYGFEQATTYLRGYSNGALEMRAATTIDMLSTVNMKGNQITNLGAGLIAAGSTDAVNGGQLFTTNQNVTTVQNAFNAIANGGGIKYFHANSTRADSAATGGEAIAIGGGAKAVGAEAIALGKDANVTSGATYSIALGGGSTADRASTVSVGRSDYQRQVVNMAKGTADTDAVNVSQLKGATTALGGGATVNADGSVKAPTYSVQGTTANDVGSALGKLDAATTKNAGDVSALNATVNNISNGGGIKYVHVNSTAADSTTMGAESIAIGGGAKAVGAASIALGNNAQNVTGSNNSIAIGGDSKSADKAVVLGNGADSSTQAWGVAVGTNSKVTGSLGTALGAAASATATNSVAIGANAVADRALTVSVGTSAQQRQIANMAKGTADTDAVNVSQLKGVTTALDGGSAVNTDGTIKAPAYTVQGATVADVGAALGKLDGATTKNTGDINTFNTTVNKINNGGGIKYFHANSTLADGVATGYESIAIGGGTQALGTETIALGKEAKATADATYSVALGSGTIADRASTVSVGRSDYQRQIVNMAKGTADTDAVNVSQLKGVTTALGGGSAVNADGTIKAPTYAVQGATASDVGTALGKLDSAVNNINSAGIKYFHVNSSMADSSVAAADSLAIGPAASVASGATNSIAIGRSAYVTANATTTGIAIGTGAKSDAVDGIAFGRDTVASVADGAALGHGAIANRASGIGGSTKGALSIGSGGATAATDTRQIISVARGTQDTDAVNLSQLKGMTTALGGGSAVNADGTVKAPTYTVQGATTNDVGSALGKLDAVTTKSTGDISTLNTTVNNISNGTAGLVQQASAGADITVAKAKDGTAVDFTGTAGTRKLKGVSKGTADTDAVNLAQLKAAGITVDANGAPTNAFVAYDSTTKDKVTLGGTSGTTVTNVKDGAVAAGSKDAVTGNQLNTTNTNVTNVQNTVNNITTGKAGLVQQSAAGAKLTVGAATDGTQVDFAGSAGARSLINVAAGAVSATSKDAINGSQLYGVSNSVATALGGASTVNADGTVKAPSYKVGGTDYNSVGGAVNALDSRFNTISGDLAPQVKYIKFGFTTALDASATGADSVAIGGYSQASGAGALALGLNSRAMADNSVAIGAGSSTSAVDTFAVGSATKQRRIVNVAAGTGINDAVTVGQMNDKIAAALSGSGVLKSSGGMLMGSSLLGATAVSSLTPDKLILAGPNGATTSASDALGDKAIAMGLNVHASGANAVAAGQNVTASGANSVGIGQNIGTGNAASAVAIGSMVSAVSDYATAIGSDGTEVNTGAIGAVAIGRSVHAGGAGTVAIGSNIVATGKDSMVLGSNSSDDARDNVVSVGSAGTVSGTTKITRQIVNVKAGTLDTDAVNVSQLKGVTTALGGGSAVNADGTIKAPAYTVQGATVADVGTALGKLDTATTKNAGDITTLNTTVNNITSGGGIKYFHASSTAADSTTSGTDAIAIGGGAKAVGTNSIAMGANAQNVTGSTLSIAIGGNTKSADRAVTIGDSADSSTQAWGVAVGTNTKVSGSLGTALGAAAQATAANSVALGANAVADRALTVSVGTSTQQRQVANMAKGTADTDAVNVSQLKGVTAALGGAAAVNSDGTIKAPTYTVNGNTYSDVGSAISAAASGGGVDAVKWNATSGAYDAAHGATPTASKIVNVADGSVASGSKDAVNGGQLYTTNQNVTNVQNTVNTITSGGGIKFFHANSSLADSAATGTNSVAVGPAATARSNNGVAIGNAANAQDGSTVSVGGLSEAKGSWSVALGTSAKTALDTSVALGSNSAVTVANSVALGDSSVADRANAVSVGNTTTQRQIMNLAKGTADTDAVNVSQLKGVTTALGGGSTVNTDGTIKAPAYTVQGATVNDVGSALTKLDGATTKSAGDITNLNTTVNNISTGKAGLVQQAAAGADITVAKANDGTAVDFTGTAGTRKLKGVSKGTADTDAVNLAQLKAAGITVDANGAPTNAFVAYDSTTKDKVTLGGASGTTIANVKDGGIASGSKEAVNGGQLFATNQNVTNVQNTVNSITNGGGIKYFHANSTRPDAAATGSETIAIGGGAQALGAETIALGKEAKTTADATYSVVLGGGSIADRAGTVSVGRSDYQRQIVNMAKGTADTDAVNVSQLKGVTAALGGGATVAADGSITRPSYTVDGKTVTGVDGAVSALDSKVATFSDLSEKVKYIKFGFTTATDASATGADSVAIGGYSQASGTGALAIGLNSRAMADNSVAIGSGSSTSAADTFAVGSATKQRRIVNVAAGTGINDAVTVGQMNDKIAAALSGSGGLKSSGGMLMGSTMLGATFTSSLTPDKLIVSGANGASTTPTDALGDKAIAMGLNVHASGANAVAAGQNVTASGANSVGIGQNIGTGNAASAVAIGSTVSAVSDYATAIGSDGTEVNTGAIGAVAIGRAVAVGGAGTVAIGSNIIATGKDSMVLGSSSSDDARDNVVSVGSAGTVSGTTKITRQIVNVKAGTLDTDAVNVSQLKGITTAIGGGAAVAADGTITRPQYDIAGTKYDTVGGALDAVEALASSGSPLGVTYDSATKDKVSLLGTSGTTLTNLKDGAVAAGSKDAVTGNQLNTTNTNVTNVQNTVNNITAGKAGLVQQSAAGAKLTVGAATDGTQVDFAGSAGARSLINVAAGAVSATSKEAVNGSQLYGASKSVADALGGSSTVNADGTVKAPTYSLGGKTYATVGDALTAIDAKAGSGSALGVAYDDATKGKVSLAGAGGTTLSNVKAGVAGTDAVNVTQLQGVATAIGGGAKVDPATGAVIAPSFDVTDASGTQQTVHTVGDAISTLDGSVQGLSGDVTKISDAMDTLSTDALKWDATAGAYSATHGSQTESRIANVADAVNAKDAVNKGQMDKALADVAAGNNPLAVSYDDSSKSSLTLGGTGATRPVQLKNVANAVDDTDAVNLGQLKSAGLVDGTGATLDAVVYDANSAKASVTFGGANGTVLNNVADGLVAQGSRQAVNGGQLYQLKSQLSQSITSIDNRVTKIENGGGTGGKADYIAVNPQAAGTGTPTPANAGTTAGIAVGYSASASGDGASAMGDHAVAQARDATAIGNGSTVTETATNSVALGNNSVADTANTVSIGSDGNERTLSHVARGSADSDVATVGQMHETLDAANSYTDQRMNDVWSDLGNEINQVNRQANRGIAAASALINVTPYVPGHTTVNAGAASYRGESALGIGVSRWSDNGRLNLNAGVSAAQNDEPVFRVGVGYIF